MPRSEVVRQGLQEVLVTSAPRTSSGDTGPLRGWGAARVLRLQLNVTAVAGTAPVLDLMVEDSIDGVNWNPVGTFPRARGVGREVINVLEPFSDTLRVRWTIGGTNPSFSFSVDCYSE